MNVLSSSNIAHALMHPSDMYLFSKPALFLWFAKAVSLSYLPSSLILRCKLTIKGNFIIMSFRRKASRHTQTTAQITHCKGEIIASCQHNN